VWPATRDFLEPGLYICPPSPGFPLTSPSLLEQLQKTLSGTYAIERELGGGGMSRVFVAEETSLGRKVVVKVLPPDLAATVNVERFRREIQLAAQLQHPLIVPVLSAGISDGLPYYTMPLVQGESLRQRISKSGELPINEVIRILRDVLSALSYAHEQGVVHRDIKPDNVLLTKHHALVTDFGVAKALSAATNPGSSLTSLGVALGTPAYMAPEQAAADPNTDHRADLYAVGATAYEMLTGRQLFSGRSPQAMLAAQAIETPEPVEKWRPTVPPALSALITRSLEKHAADRPQSADEMLNVLHGLMTPSGGTTPTMTVPVPAVKPKRSMMPLLAGAGVLAVVALAGFLVMKGRSPKPPPLDENRVMIAPFENKTGDPKYDAVGGMATDWVTRGLTETGIVDVAPYSPKRDANGKLGTDAFDASTLAGDARTLSASKFVTGAFYKQGDSLQFQADIIDVNDGKSLGAVTPSLGPASSPMVALAALRARVVNALGELTRSDRGGFSTQDVPPTFDAYKEFLQGEDAFNSRDFPAAMGHYEKAAKLDPNYIAPVVRGVYALINMRQYAKADSLGRSLDAKRGSISPYETHYLDRGMAWTRGDWYAGYTAARALLATAPKSSFAAYIAARSAMQINRPREAVEGLEKLGPAAQHTSGYFSDLAVSYHMLGEFDRELEIAQRYRAANAGLIEALSLNARPLAALGRTTDLHEVLNAAAAMPRSRGVGAREIYAAAIRELLVHGHPDLARTFATEFLSYLQAEPVMTRDSANGIAGIPATTTAGARVFSLTVLGRYREAKALADSLGGDRADALSYLATEGELAALLGDRAGAEKILAQLGTMAKPYDRGASVFAQAQVAARVGQKEQTVQLLRIALSRGVVVQQIHVNPAFVTMKGFAPFDELVKPKG
jgi:tRNA A-37 threonylcarbamoyl transferase component Bud32/tetratricopeptide (TPR) repeat protein